MTDQSTKIELEGRASTQEVWLNGKPLRPERSLKLKNHSPTGFNWGYEGSGPAQLALAILLELTDNKDIALSNYQQFKRKFIATLPQDDFKSTFLVPADYIKQKEAR